MPSKRKKREAVQIGASSINCSDLEGLRTAFRARHLVVFLGAGVSIPYGLPPWRNLVLELLFEQTAQTRRLGPALPHYRRALAAWMTDYFEYNPLVLARMVERDLGRRRRAKSGAGTARSGTTFLEALRKHLYADHRPRTSERTALRAIAQLIQRDGVAAAVTFNFDDLLEQELKSLGVPVTSVVDGSRQHGPGFRVVHPHGFVPMKGSINRANLVFTEDDYHRLTESVFHWGLSDIVGHLRRYTALFVGLSMSDPSLRRLLDACHNSEVPAHWQIQKRHEIRDQEVMRVLQDVEERAKVYGKILGLSETKRPGVLEDAVHDALRQADTYDREVFESMGVKTVWLNDWEDLPSLIDAIGGDGT